MKTRTVKTVILFLAILVLAASAALPLARAEEAQRVIATPRDAEEFIRVLLGDDPASLDGAYPLTAPMARALQGIGGFAGLAKSLASLGKAEGIGPAYAAGTAAFRVPCAFAAMPLDLVISLENGAIAGLTTAAYSGRTETADAGFDTVELSLPVPALNGALPGILTLPRGDGPFPAVVLVHGSGPSDRDESIPGTGLHPFRDIAEALAERGVAVYRYDKRTYVYLQEMAADHQITLMEETVEDAAAAVQLLAAQEKIDAGRIFVLGHSLGGTAIPAVDRALKDAPVQAKGYILLAPGARPLDEMIREQYDFLYSLQPEITEAMQAEKDQLFSELDKLKDLDALTENDLISGAYAPYWKWLAAYDALETAREITAPCLLLQGEEDYQVTMEDFALWREAVGSRDNWTLTVLPGLTHLFVPGLKTDGAAYTQDPNARVDDRAVQQIADFILK